jgi:hypothetical protein
MLEVNITKIKYMSTIIFTLISYTLVHLSVEKDEFLESSYATEQDTSDIVINLQRSGGFGNLLPVNYTLDSDLLSNEENIKLQALVKNSNFYNLKNESISSKKGADYYVYKITVENNGTSKNINTTDFSMPKELKDLISFVMDVYKK